MLLIRNHIGTVFIVSIILLALIPNLPYLQLCPIKMLTGHNCPTCGVTHAVWHIMHGRFINGWQANPIGYLVILETARYALRTFPKLSLGSERQFDFIVLGLFLFLGFLKTFTIPIL